MTVHRSAHLASVTLDGSSSSVVSIPQCRTCQSPFRDEIEGLLTRGFSYTSIVRSLPVEADLTSRHLRDHVANQHLASDGHMAVRLAKEALERGETLDGAVQVLRDDLRLARKTVAAVEARLDAGEIQPDLKEGLAAMALLARYDQQAEEVLDNDRAVQGFNEYWMVTRQIMTADQFAELRVRLTNNPVLQALIGRSASRR